MNHILIENIPQILFAHIFEIDRYGNTLSSEKNHLEVSYIAEGNLTINDGFQTQTAEVGDIVFNTYRLPLLLNSQGKHVHHTVCFQLPFEFCTDAQALTIPLITKSSPDTTKIRALIDEIIRIHTITPSRHLQCAGIFLEILSILDECNTNRKKATSFSDLLYINNAKDYIYKNLSRHIFQSEIAAHLKISPQYLCSVFKKSEGISLVNFINKIKLEKLRELMEKQNLKLYQAAELLGFSDPNYVSNLYKKYYHINITDSFKKIRKKDTL